MSRIALLKKYKTETKKIYFTMLITLLFGLIYDFGDKISNKIKKYSQKINSSSDYYENKLFGSYQPPLLRHQNLYLKIVIDCLVVSFGFAVIETCFRYIKDGTYTTWEQFVMNLFYTPILINLYKKVFKSYFFRVLFFPFNVWIAEIVMGSYLLYLHGYRVWIYTDSLSLFNGFITLSFAHYWISLGVIVFLIL